MANVFAILTAIALLASAYLAHKNKEAYGKEIDLRKETQQRLETSQARLANLTDEFNATESERMDTESAVASLQEQKTATEKKASGLTAQVEEKKALAEANAKKIDEVQEALKETGEIEELVGIIKRTLEETESLTEEIASGKGKLADLMSEKSRTEAVMAEYRGRNENFTSRKSFFDSTRISAIYPTYGFVTLPIGNTAGVVPNSRLDVIRDGAAIAKLRVRTVESGRSAAEIIPDSLAADTTLMVGDRVVPSSDSDAN